MQFSCAGKIFITGEYACIEGGPALLGTVAPRFWLTTEATSSSSHLSDEIPFAAASPAGVLLSRHRRLLKGVKLTWADPYETPIGVGSSSAQFILSVALVAKLLGKPQPGCEEVLETYWDVVGESQGLRPSGADVVAQWLGGPVLITNKPFAAQKLPIWEASSPGDFLLAFTGKKARTHEHLLALKDKGFPASYERTLHLLNKLTRDAAQAWRTGDVRALGETLNEYQLALTEGGLGALEFESKLEEIQSWPGVYGVKGTGAQGGDCLLLLVNRDQIPEIKARVKREGWEPIVVAWSNAGMVAG